MNRNELLQLHNAVTHTARNIMVAKNHDYASEEDPFANFKGASTFGVSPIVGLLLRVQDKLQRIKTFAVAGHLKVPNESVEDAISDVVNYMVLLQGLILEEGGKGHLVAFLESSNCGIEKARPSDKRADVRNSEAGGHAGEGSDNSESSSHTENSRVPEVPRLGLRGQPLPQETNDSPRADN